MLVSFSVCRTVIPLYVELSWSLSVTQCQMSAQNTFGCSRDLLRSSGSHLCGLCCARSGNNFSALYHLKASAFAISAVEV